MRATVPRGERLTEWETIRLRRDGAPLRVAVSAGPVPDRQGRDIGAVVVIADLTERWRASSSS